MGRQRTLCGTCVVACTPLIARCSVFFSGSLQFSSRVVGHGFDGRSCCGLPRQREKQIIIRIKREKVRSRVSLRLSNTRWNSADVDFRLFQQGRRRRNPPDDHFENRELLSLFFNLWTRDLVSHFPRVHSFLLLLQRGSQNKFHSDLGSPHSELREYGQTLRCFVRKKRQGLLAEQKAQHVTRREKSNAITEKCTHVNVNDKNKYRETEEQRKNVEGEEEHTRKHRP